MPVYGFAKSNTVYTATDGTRRTAAGSELVAVAPLTDAQQAAFRAVDGTGASPFVGVLNAAEMVRAGQLVAVTWP